MARPAGCRLAVLARRWRGQTTCPSVGLTAGEAAGSGPRSVGHSSSRGHSSGWEWKRAKRYCVGVKDVVSSFVHHMMVALGAHSDIYDENGRPDPDRWGEFDAEAMTMLDIEWAKGEGARGAVLVRSGGSDYLVDLTQMTQADVEEDRTGLGMGGPATRRVRRRRIRAEIGRLGIGETLSVMEDPSLSGDTIIAPQSYIEQLDMFKIGRRDRAAVFRLSLLGSGEHDTETPTFIYCRAMEFSGMKARVPTWMARALQIPAFGSGSSARVPSSHGSCPRVAVGKLKCITPGFEELVRAALQRQQTVALMSHQC